MAPHGTVPQSPFLPHATPGASPASQHGASPAAAAGFQPYAPQPAQPAQPHGQPVQQPISPSSAFGALALGYPDVPWTCPACTLINIADRLECAACETERPPLNVGAANARTRDLSYGAWGAFGAWGVPQKASDPALHAAPDAQRQPTLNAEGSIAASHAGPGGDEDKDMARVACLSQEQVGYLVSAGNIVYQLFKTVMACMLTLFVPQWCPTYSDDVPPQIIEEHECTMEDNFTDLDQMNQVALGWNFFTLFLCFIHYYLVWRREKVFIEWLDEDPTVTNDYLVRKNRRGQTVIEMYPKIEAAVRKNNTAVLVISIAVLLSFVVNIILSGIVCFRDWYAGYRTVTVFLTNVSLTVSVLLTQANHAYTGVKTGIALSMFKSDPAVYNAIDRRLRKDPEFFVPRKKATESEVEMNNTTYRVK